MFTRGYTTTVGKIPKAFGLNDAKIIGPLDFIPGTMAFLFWEWDFHVLKVVVYQCLNSPSKKKTHHFKKECHPIHPKLSKLYIWGIHKNHKHIQPGDVLCLDGKINIALRPPESSLKKTIGRFRRDRAVLSTPQKSTCLYRAGAVGIAIVAMTAMTAMMIKREEKRYLFRHFMAFYDVWEVPNKTSHFNMAWYRDFWESSEIYCLLFANFWKMRWASGITFSPAHAITLLTAHVTPRGQMQQKQNLK